MSAMREDLRALQRMHRESSADLNRLWDTHAASTDDLIRTVRDRDTARADADRLRGEVSDLRTFSSSYPRSVVFELTHICSLCYLLQAPSWLLLKHPKKHPSSNLRRRIVVSEICSTPTRCCYVSEMPLVTRATRS